SFRSLFFPNGSIANEMTWLEAQKYCREHHTDLISGQDQLDDLKNHTKLNGTRWMIGLFRDTWRWSDGNGSSFRNWDQTPQSNHCAMLKNFELVDVNDKRKASFICYNGKKLYPTMTWLKAQKYCRENHTDLISGQDQLDDLKNHTKLNGARWMIGLFSDTWRWSDGNVHQLVSCSSMTANVVLIPLNKTWDQAVNYCREHHHDLVHVRNKHQQRWVGQIAQMANSPFVWLGLHYTCTLQFWFWVTDKSVRYNNWASDQPMNHCDMSGAMEKGGKNQWYKKPDENQFNFICSSEKSKKKK
uniref:C-type lectin domain-containing protein n=1 Tax=Sphaeramia orbicularis TaxID=375764 RepID=A0A673C8I1_9TELE